MPIITLTTDFGTRDHFVAVMKGVILGIAPKVSIVDITHEIEPFAVGEAAFTLGEAWQWFPKKTIHVCVVDPGVGSMRRPILVEAGGHYLVGPDNGSFGLICARDRKARVRHLTSVRYFAQERSQTFHGRDVFAPVAAQLALGVRPASLGAVIADVSRTTLEAPVRTSTRTWAGAVLKVDRFGNLITNFHLSEFPDLARCQIAMIAGIQPVDYLVRCYADAPPGEAVAIIGSSGYLEVIVNQGSAAKRLGCGVGAPVELSIL